MTSLPFNPMSHGSTHPAECRTGFSLYTFIFQSAVVAFKLIVAFGKFIYEMVVVP